MTAISNTRLAGPGSDFASLPNFALICFSHLRWNCVPQRPQHLMSRFAHDHRVIFWEAPVEVDSVEATIDVRLCRDTGVCVITPQLPSGLDEAEQQSMLRSLLEIYLAGQQGPLVRWYYTPMMLPFSRQIEAVCTVYDCIDEPADPRLMQPGRPALERELFELADIVFAGGYNVYAAGWDGQARVDKRAGVSWDAAFASIVEMVREVIAVPDPKDADVCRRVGANDPADELRGRDSLVAAE